MVILLAYQAIEMRIHPRPEPPAADAVPQDVPEDAEGPEEPPAPVTVPDAAEASTTDSSRAEIDEGQILGTEANADTKPVDAADQVKFDGPQEAWTTIGTLDHSRPEKLLVWFTNRGAAIECMALNDARYTDLDVRQGYLGYLALRETADGCRIGAVGQGTPAANAQPSATGQPQGLQAGDILERIDEVPITNPQDYRDWVENENTRPGQTVRIRVRRQLDGQWQTLEYSATLDHRPLEIIHPEPEKPTASNPRHPYSYLLGIQQLGNDETDFASDLSFRVDEVSGLPSLKNETWEMRQIEQDGVPGVEFHFVLSPEQLQPFGVKGPLRVIKRYTLARCAEGETDRNAGFNLRYEISFRNEGTDGPPIRFAYQQNGPNGLPLEGWWYTYKTHPTSFGGAGVRDIVFRAVGGRHEMFTNPKIVERIEDPNPMTLMVQEGQEPVLDYIGVDSQYFASALLPAPEELATAPDHFRLADAMALAVAAKDPTKASRTNVSFRIISPIQTLGPEEAFTQQFLIFAGPKLPDVLKKYGLEECITYGWFRVVAKPLQMVLHAFHAVFRNYGIAIILLTVMVRGLMFPVGRQQVLNAQKMQELAPEMRRIAEQYKNDMEKRAAAQRELFRKHNYNPMAGCLPMFFQLPIFIGLYRALSVDIELRQAPLIPGLHWCSNLAGPDQLLYWENFMPAFLASRTGWLGPYLNILPLISVAFMMVHQKMFTPPPTDEQQEMQQRMMKFMMMFFALMFFRVPAGLCLYFITSSAWGLAERKLLPKPKPSSAAGGSESGGLLKKMLAVGSGNSGGAQQAANKRRPKSRRR